MQKQFIAATLAAACLLARGTAQAQTVFPNSLPAATIQQHMTDPFVKQFRGGGTTGNSLGCYRYGHDVSFSSPYRDVDDTTRAKFAHSLHDFVVANGGGYENVSNWVKNGTAVPYENQARYAEQWFWSNYRDYRGVGIFFREQFIYEALLDATNLYYRTYQSIYPNPPVRYIAYVFASINRLSQKR